jgi:hypothetical protein
MEDETERAEAFLKETLDAVEKGTEACARGYPASTEPSTLSIGSRAVKHLTIGRPEQRQLDDDAQKRCGQSILVSSCNIVLPLQYCHKPFIPRRMRVEPGRYASFFLGAFNTNVRSPVNSLETLGISAAVEGSSSVSLLNCATDDGSGNHQCPGTIAHEQERRWKQ